MLHSSRKSSAISLTLVTKVCLASESDISLDDAANNSDGRNAFDDNNDDPFASAAYIHTNKSSTHML